MLTVAGKTMVRLVRWLSERRMRMLFVGVMALVHPIYAPAARAASCSDSLRSLLGLAIYPPGFMAAWAASLKSAQFYFLKALDANDPLIKDLERLGFVFDKGNRTVIAPD